MRSRWRQQDVAQAVAWLEGCSQPGIYKVLKRLGFSRKQALRFIHSPDPNYRFKWQRVLLAYQEALQAPGEVVLLFMDEFTYYRCPQLQPTWQPTGSEQARLHQTSGANTKARLVAVLDALTGRVLYLQRATVGRHELATFYHQIRAAYPQAQRIYLVADNWPVHYHPLVLAAAQQANLTCLWLPTYASWLNPIEKLWRWLRQDILHNHDRSHEFKSLRQQVETWLDQFASASFRLLNYVGILSKQELAAIPVLNC
jgi:transposase